jgi:hypothetical protein
MDSKELRGLMEAYSEVYAPQEVDEATAVASPAPGGRGRKNSYTKEIRTGASTKTSSKYSNVSDAKERMKTPLSRYDAPKMQLKKEEYVDEAQYTAPPQPQQRPAEVRKAPKNKLDPGATVGTGIAAAYVGNEIGKKLLKKKPGVRGVFEEADIFDVVLEFLQTEGYAETLEEAEWMMANVIDEEAIDIILEAYVDYRKGKLSTGKSPQQTLAGRHERVKATAARERGAASSTDSLMTPATKRSQKLGQARREMDANTSFGGKVNKVVNLGRRDNAGPSVQRGEPNTARHQQAIDARAKKPRNEEYVDEAQVANRDPDKYEREQAKKSAPVRGERTPMPPRGDKRREDFEKWYAKQMGR